MLYSSTFATNSEDRNYSNHLSGDLIAQLKATIATK